MKLVDKMLEQTNEDDNIVANAMIYIERLIFSEIVDIDAITKWEEFNAAIKENREIRFINYEKTEVPSLVVSDLNFSKAVERKAEQIAQTIFFEMETSDFEKWVMDLKLLIFESKKMTI